ncbi:MAG TPA: hypothetical protein VGD71_14615, partial [Kribbella sp.]
MTASGYVTIDRWLVLNPTVVAFMPLARKRSSSGEAVLSRVEIAYQVGLFRHAATVVLPENSEVRRDHREVVPRPADPDQVPGPQLVMDVRRAAPPGHLPEHSNPVGVRV